MPKVTNAPEFKQDYRIENYPDGVAAQFIYKGFEISFAKSTKYDVVDVVVFKEPNDTEIVFRGLTVERCINWINQTYKESNNV